MMKKIAVIGSLSTDFVVSTDIIPNQGETVVGKQIKTFFGGKGANQAVAISRSGVETFMLGAVGEDSFGSDLLKNLQDNHIDTSMMKIVKGVSSGSAFIQVYEGDNRIIIIEGSNASLTIDDIKKNEEKLKQMNLLVLQNEIPTEVIEYVIKFAAANDIVTVYNPAPIKKIDEKMLDLVDYLTPNEHEFNALFPNQTLEEALERFPNKLIVTLGDKGATYHDKTEIKLVPSEKIAKVVDTTGAGDTFNGYLAYGLLNGKTIEEAIMMGNKAAGLAIQKEGAQSGIPTIDEVK